jgi:crossover junction endodeoxyribonuclease RuvC
VRIIGIDTSLTSTGLAVVGDRLCTTMRVESAPPKRAKGDKTPIPIEQRRRRIRDIVDRIHAWAPCELTTLAVIEGPSYSSTGTSTWDRAWLWGAVIDRLLADDIPVALAPPAVRAKWATGSGVAGKSPVAVHLSRMWPDVDPGISDDEWDALALASMGAQHLGLLSVEQARHREQLGKVAWPDVPVREVA